MEPVPTSDFHTSQASIAETPKQHPGSSKIVMDLLPLTKAPWRSHYLKTDRHRGKVCAGGVRTPTEHAFPQRMGKSLLGPPRTYNVSDVSEVDGGMLV